MRSGFRTVTDLTFSQRLFHPRLTRSLQGGGETGLYNRFKDTVWGKRGIDPVKLTAYFQKAEGNTKWLTAKSWAWKVPYFASHMALWSGAAVAADHFFGPVFGGHINYLNDLRAGISELPLMTYFGGKSVLWTLGLFLPIGRINGAKMLMQCLKPDELISPLSQLQPKTTDFLLGKLSMSSKRISLDWAVKLVSKSQNPEYEPKFLQAASLGALTEDQANKIVNLVELRNSDIANRIRSAMGGGNEHLKTLQTLLGDNVGDFFDGKTWQKTPAEAAGKIIERIKSNELQKDAAIENIDKLSAQEDLPEIVPKLNRIKQYVEFAIKNKDEDPTKIAVEVIRQVDGNNLSLPSAEELQQLLGHFKSPNDVKTIAEGLGFLKRVADVKDPFKIAEEMREEPATGLELQTGIDHFDLLRALSTLPAYKEKTDLIFKIHDFKRSGEKELIDRFNLRISDLTNIDKWIKAMLQQLADDYGVFTTRDKYSEKAGLVLAGCKIKIYSTILELAEKKISQIKEGIRSARDIPDFDGIEKDVDEIGRELRPLLPSAPEELKARWRAAVTSLPHMTSERLRFIDEIGRHAQTVIDINELYAHVGILLRKHKGEDMEDRISGVGIRLLIRKAWLEYKASENKDILSRELGILRESADVIKNTDVKRSLLAEIEDIKKKIIEGGQTSLPSFANQSPAFLRITPPSVSGAPPQMVIGPEGTGIRAKTTQESVETVNAAISQGKELATKLRQPISDDDKIVDLFEANIRAPFKKTQETLQQLNLKINYEQLPGISSDLSLQLTNVQDELRKVYDKQLNELIVHVTTNINKTKELHPEDSDLSKLTGEDKLSIANLQSELLKLEEIIGQDAALYLILISEEKTYLQNVISRLGQIGDARKPAATMAEAALPTPKAEAPVPPVFEVSSEAEPPVQAMPFEGPPPAPATAQPAPKAEAAAPEAAPLAPAATPAAEPAKPAEAPEPSEEARKRAKQALADDEF